MKTNRLRCLLLAFFGMAALPACAQDVVNDDVSIAQGSRIPPLLLASASDFKGEDTSDVSRNLLLESRALPLRDAEALIKDGRAADAYALLAPLEAERFGEVRFEYLLGMAALESGKPEQAVHAFEKLLSIHPGFAGAHLDLARAYYQLGNLPRAKTEFETVLMANPSDAARSTARKYLAAIGAPINTKIILAANTEGTADSSPVPVAASTDTNTPDNNGNTALVRIDRFLIKGNTLLDPNQIDTLLEPFKGDAKSYTDIQLALEALEGAYRSAGYSAVHVVTPEQEITGDTVIFEVVETVVDKVTLKGNQYYDDKNIRNALPALVEGKTPSAHELSENIQLANQNPTRQLDVVLAVGDADNTVDAVVNVQDVSPHKFYVTADNTGSQSTGMNRVGIGYQNNNLFNRDQAATFNYVTSPSDVKDVTQVSASYRLPLYSLGDSIDLIGAYSNANIGVTTTTAGSFLVSNGRVFSFRYNHYLPRRGEYVAKVIGGFDYRESTCSILASDCPGISAPVTVRPISIAYEGTLTHSSYVADATASFNHNISGGKNGDQDYFVTVLGAGAKADYNVLRLSGSLTGSLPSDWQYRGVWNSQLTHDVMVPSESLGLVGANAVRGFVEREVTNDNGYVVNLELYSPELAPKIKLSEGSLKFLGFIDHARGWNQTVSSAGSSPSSLGSVGLGLRFSYSKYLSAKVDWARVTDANGDNLGSTTTGEHRAQFSLIGTW